jgi:hypothetical protein
MTIEYMPCEKKKIRHRTNNVFSCCPYLALSGFAWSSSIRDEKAKETNKASPRLVVSMILVWSFVFWSLSYPVLHYIILACLTKYKDKARQGKGWPKLGRPRPTSRLKQDKATKQYKRRLYNDKSQCNKDSKS